MEEPYAVIPPVRICAGYHAWKRMKIAVKCVKSTATVETLLRYVHPITSFSYETMRLSGARGSEKLRGKIKGDTVRR